MPASMQRSLSPSIAFAVIATIPGRVSRRDVCDDVAGCLEPVHFGHLFVHQDQVATLALDGLDRLEPVRRDIGLVAHPRQKSRGRLSRRRYETEPRTFRISGMTCDHCERAVVEEVSALPGVDSAEVNLESRQLTVSGERSVRQ